MLPGGDLAMGLYEVTMGEYRAFASATGGGAGSGCYALGDVDSWRDPRFPQRDRHPYHVQIAMEVGEKSIMERKGPRKDLVEGLEV